MNITGKCILISAIPPGEHYAPPDRSCYYLTIEVPFNENEHAPNPLYREVTINIHPKAATQ